MNLLSVKEEIISFLKSLPDNITLEEILYHLYVKEKIKKGQEEIEKGQIITQEEIEVQIEEWFK